jgi:hypothetical protein
MSICFCVFGNAPLTYTVSRVYVVEHAAEVSAHAKNMHGDGVDYMSRYLFLHIPTWKALFFVRQNFFDSLISRHTNSLVRVGTNTSITKFCWCVASSI